ncbi:uncharacterized protein [Oryza sativa Japonica Group]|uniref:uncharacterized protein n=1 Tax=Oryza sativa subsp. japonica TaxID=39947 RepID=UPI000E1C379D|nr:uncharacterized protein LOC112939843 isoform X3 [Oryza sativa Japonica Group]
MILRGQTLVLSPALSMMVDQLRKLHAFLPDGLLASSQDVFREIKAYASEFCRKEHQALEISLTIIWISDNNPAVVPVALSSSSRKPLHCKLKLMHTG